MNNDMKYGMMLASGCDEVATLMALELAERAWFTKSAWHWADLAQCASSCLGVILDFGNGEKKAFSTVKESGKKLIVVESDVASDHSIMILDALERLGFIENK